MILRFLSQLCPIWLCWAGSLFSFFRWGSACLSVCRREGGFLDASLWQPCSLFFFLFFSFLTSVPRCVWEGVGCRLWSVACSSPPSLLPVSSQHAPRVRVNVNVNVSVRMRVKSEVWYSPRGNPAVSPLDHLLPPTDCLSLPLAADASLVWVSCEHAKPWITPNPSEVFHAPH